MAEEKQMINNSEIENPFKNISDNELLERYNDISKRYTIYVEDLKLFLSKFTNIRTEIIQVESELRKRGVLKDGII
jgi:hypothetical protein